MNLIRSRNNDIFDSLSEFKKLQREINRLFDFDREPEYSGLFDRRFSPALDIVEEEGCFILTCDLPGVEEKNLDISLAANVLTIKGVKGDEKDLENRKIYRRETWGGGFQRTLSLPDTIDPEKVDAELKNGILTLVIPKKEEVKPKQIAVKVK